MRQRRPTVKNIQIGVTEFSYTSSVVRLVGETWQLPTTLAINPTIDSGPKLFHPCRRGGSSRRKHGRENREVNVPRRLQPARNYSTFVVHMRFFSFA